MVQIVPSSSAGIVTGFTTTNVLSLEAFGKVCGNLAPWAAAAVFLAPLPTVRGIAKYKSVGNLPLVPYTAMIGNCFLWTTYGLLKKEPKLWSINSFGLVLGWAYFLSFIRHAPTKSTTLPGSVNQHFQVILALLLATTLAATLLTDRKLAISLIGSVGVLLAILLAASPLAALKTVLTARSAQSIPLPFTLAALVNGFLWAGFGIFALGDINIYLPNVLGFLCALAQLALKIKFGNGPPTLPM